MVYNCKICGFKDIPRENSAEIFVRQQINNGSDVNAIFLCKSCFAIYIGSHVVKKCSLYNTVYSYEPCYVCDKKIIKTQSFAVVWYCKHKYKTMFHIGCFKEMAGEELLNLLDIT